MLTAKKYHTPKKVKNRSYPGRQMPTGLLHLIGSNSSQPQD